MKEQPFISVIVPAHNAAQELCEALEAINNSSYPSYELIVVDDASTDETARVARQKDAFVLQLPFQSGPAAARNHGTERAKCDILLFVDSDVLVREDTIAWVAKNFIDHPDVAALFGSYDDDPAKKNFSSQYMNLRHHFVHQMSRRKAVTFWAG